MSTACNPPPPLPLYAPNPYLMFRNTIIYFHVQNVINSGFRENPVNLLTFVRQIWTIRKSIELIACGKTQTCISHSCRAFKFARALTGPLETFEMIIWIYPSFIKPYYDLIRTFYELTSSQRFICAHDAILCGLSLLVFVLYFGGP